MTRGPRVVPPLIFKIFEKCSKFSNFWQHKLFQKFLNIFWSAACTGPRVAPGSHFSKFSQNCLIFGKINLLKYWKFLIKYLYIYSCPILCSSNLVLILANIHFFQNLILKILHISYPPSPRPGRCSSLLYFCRLLILGQCAFNILCKFCYKMSKSKLLNNSIKLECIETFWNEIFKKLTFIKIFSITRMNSVLDEAKGEMKYEDFLRIKFWKNWMFTKIRTLNLFKSKWGGENRQSGNTIFYPFHY